MAADTACYAGETLQGFTTKIARGPDGSLAGAAGNTTLCHEFLELWREGINAGGWRPTIVGEARFSAIVVMPDGLVWEWDETGRSLSRAPFHADGSAHPMLIGAMAAGASAEEAVEIAIRYSAHCGGEIQVERLSHAGVLPRSRLEPKMPGGAAIPKDAAA
jgi:hypothetical protein